MWLPAAKKSVYVVAELKNFVAFQKACGLSPLFLPFTQWVTCVTADGRNHTPPEMYKAS